MSSSESDSEYDENVPDNEQNKMIIMTALIVMKMRETKTTETTPQNPQTKPLLS